MKRIRCLHDHIDQRKNNIIISHYLREINMQVMASSIIAIRHMIHLSLIHIFFVFGVNYIGLCTTTAERTYRKKHFEA